LFHRQAASRDGAYHRVAKRVLWFAISTPMILACDARCHVVCSVIGPLGFGRKKLVLCGLAMANLFEGTNSNAGLSASPGTVPAFLLSSKTGGWKSDGATGHAIPNGKM
jgi:hypothetical protein